MSNKCQIYYTPNNKCHIWKAIKMPNRWSLSEYQLKYTGKGVNLNTNGQIIIKGNPTLPEQSVNAFIEEKQNEITVHMSSNFYHRNADENINVRNSKGTTVSHTHFRLRREALAKWLLEFLGIPRIFLGIPRNSNSENQWLSLKSCKSKKIPRNFWEFLGIFRKI